MSTSRNPQVALLSPGPMHPNMPAPIIAMPENLIKSLRETVILFFSAFLTILLMGPPYAVPRDGK
jgi:hypothetical protein